MPFWRRKLSSYKEPFRWTEQSRAELCGTLRNAGHAGTPAANLHLEITHEWAESGEWPGELSSGIMGWIANGSFVDRCGRVPFRMEVIDRDSEAAEDEPAEAACAPACGHLWSVSNQQNYFTSDGLRGVLLLDAARLSDWQSSLRSHSAPTGPLITLRITPFSALDEADLKFLIAGFRLQVWPIHPGQDSLRPWDYEEPRQE